MSQATTRRWALAAIALVAASGLAACSSGTGSSASGVTEVRFTQLWSGNAGKIISGIVADYNKSQSKVHVTVQSNPDITQQLASMTSANGNFDISDGFGTDVASWASKGVLLPLDKYNIDTSDFLAPDMKQMKYDGKLYTVPFASHSYKLLYNKKLFAEAGITAAPTTMDEWAQDIAKTTKQDAAGKITQLGFGTTSAYNTLTTLGFAFGGKWDADGKPSPKDPALRKALDWYQTNVTDKYGAKNIADYAAGYGQYLSAEDPFYAGKVAMILDGEWQATVIPSVVPNLEWGVADIPAASPNLKNATQIFNSMFFIPSNAKQKDAAVDFLKYMTSSTGIKAWTTAGGDAPARKSLLSDPAYQKVTGLNVWLNGMTSPNAASFASAPYTSQYTSDLTSALQDMTLGVVTPEQAIDRIATAAQSYKLK